MNDELSIRRIGYFFEAVQQGSVRGAADKLDINASAVSRQIALLEEEIGARLLERFNRGVRPTEVGALLLDYYQTHAAMHRDLVERVREVKGLQRGHISIRLGAGFVSDLLGGPLASFHRRYPEITFEIETSGTNDVVTSVLQDTAHLGLVYNPETSADIRSRASARKPLCAIVAPSHPLATEISVSMKAISRFPVVLKEISFGTMQLVNLAAKSEKVELTKALATNSSSVMFDFVKNSQAIAFGPAFSVAQEVSGGTLAAIPIDHPVLVAAEAHLITRHSRSLPHAAQRLAQHLADSMVAFRP